MRSEAATCAGSYRRSCALVGVICAHLSASIGSDSVWQDIQSDARVARQRQARIGVIRQPR